ncbi:MAG: phytanoyl-CoA dioxygenase [Bacteroidetes bacterium]|nr:phytanoyl-CoA dioxygenase [Bacteroidota bacterium]
MTDETIYTINQEEMKFSTKGSPEFRYGNDERLSREDTDITYHQPWYDKGFTEHDFLSEEQFASLLAGITNSISAIIEEECSIDVDGFTLEKYHEYVTTNEDHFKVISRTRDLFSKDFTFPVEELIPRFEEILGMKLSDVDPRTNKKVHIIVRINRPQSNDFNPPHKDVYEVVDNRTDIVKFVNLWIPIAGVNENSNLPLAPESHKLLESQILRTFDGGTIQGNKYSVRMIKSWNGKSDLVRSTVKYGQVLIFSGHLIHGLAVNSNTDKTRVALEFRLSAV